MRKSVNKYKKRTDRHKSHDLILTKTLRLVKNKNKEIKYSHRPINRGGGAFHFFEILGGGTPY